jgi:hypothetical protein
MKLKQLLSILIFSVLITIFGWYIDSDIPNEKMLTTIFEFVMMIVLTFCLFSFLYFGFQKIKMFFKKSYLII